MNPRERWGLLLIDEQPERLPVFPLITSHSAIVQGINLIEYCTDGKKLADSQITAQRKYRHDGLSVFSDVGIVAEAMGSKYRFREFEVPILAEPVLKNLDDFDVLLAPEPSSDGRLPVYIEAIERLYNLKGDVLPVFAYIPSPFTTAAGVRGIDNFLIDTIMNPKEVEVLLEICLVNIKRFCDACFLAGALPILVDPLASGSVISRRTFENFALPYNRELISYLHRFDLDVTLHICGETSSIVDLIIDTGADLFSFDQISVNEVRNSIGDKVRLVGNFPPHSLLKSSKIDILEGSRAIIDSGLKTPRGFVFSTGCEVPIKCDCRKLKVIIQLGKNYKHAND